MLNPQRAGVQTKRTGGGPHSESKIGHSSGGLASVASPPPERLLTPHEP